MPLRRTNEGVMIFILSFLDNKSVLRFSQTSKLHRLLSRHAALWATVDLSSKSDIGIDVVSELVSLSNDSIPLKKLIINCNIDPDQIHSSDFIHHEPLPSEINESFVEINLIKLLVVDNSLSAFKLINSALANSIKSITNCQDGSSALNLMKNNQYDLVIMDVNISVMNGFEVSKSLREFETKYRKEFSQIIIGTSIGSLINFNLVLK